MWNLNLRSAAVISLFGADESGCTARLKTSELWRSCQIQASFVQHEKTNSFHRAEMGRIRHFILRAAACLLLSAEVWGATVIDQTGFRLNTQMKSSCYCSGFYKASVHRLIMNLPGELFINYKSRVDGGRGHGGGYAEHLAVLLRGGAAPPLHPYSLLIRHNHRLLTPTEHQLHL